MQRRGRKVCVIGAGPAGIATAQQCIREGIEEVSVIEKGKIGGLIAYANRIENLPGFVGSEGRKLVGELEDIVELYDIDIIYGDVDKVRKDSGGFQMGYGGGELTSQYVVLATGTAPLSLGFPGEIYEPPWRDYAAERIAIIGGGDVAYDYALRLDRSGAEVVIIRRSEPKALESLVREVRVRGIREIRGEVKRCEEDRDCYLLSCGTEDIESDLVVVAIGRKPSSPVVSPPYSTVEFPTGRTDIENLYAVGSLTLGIYRQTALSWGMGIAAGMEISSRIEA